VKVFEAMKDIFVEVFEDLGVNGFFAAKAKGKRFKFGSLVMFGDDGLDEFADHFKRDE